jgi:hypothetical protein
MTRSRCSRTSGNRFTESRANWGSPSAPAPNYARNNPSPDGSRRVILATNRPVSFRELRDNSRRLQYQFTLIEIHIDKSGKGEGKLVPAAKVSWDKEAKKIEIENYNALPVDLLNVVAKTP